MDMDGTEEVEDGHDDDPDSVLPVDEFIGPEEHSTRRALRHLHDAVVVLLATGEVVSTVQLDIALENAWGELMWTAK